MTFDFRNPDYPAVYAERMRRLAWIRADSARRLPALRVHYRHHPADFINDWGETFDPRLIERGLPPWVPFVLMPKQGEFIEWAIERWLSGDGLGGIAEKTRDAGLSWLAVSLACTLCLFYDGMSIGFGSRKEEYVDKLDGPKSLFYKGRKFMERLPPEFNGGWNPKTDAPHMRMIFRKTGASITGEAGDNIGRGDRQALYFVDEEAHIERPQLLEAAISATTRCRISISTPNGPANPFAIKRHSGRIPVFTFSWRDDLRKDDEWYEAQKSRLDPVTLAQEVDIDYNASVEGVLIPSAWVQSAVNAHGRLGVSISGEKFAALDIADEGQDLNALCGGYGFLVDCIEEWSGRGGDIFQTVERSFNLCDEHGYTGFLYDSDGLGASARGDARVINERRKAAGQRILTIDPFRGSGEVAHPERKDFYDRMNKDFFFNRKAQAWWSLRYRFQRTHRWVAEGMECPVDEIISLDPKMPLLAKLTGELCQPTYTLKNGKVLVDKAPDGAKSPNLADAVMIRFSGARSAPMRINPQALARARQR